MRHDIDEEKHRVGRSYHARLLLNVTFMALSLISTGQIKLARYSHTDSLELNTGYNEFCTRFWKVILFLPWIMKRHLN